MIRQVCYLSTATHEYSADVLDGILDCSRHNNAAADLTGMLVYGGGVFFQVLEGPSASLSQCLERIARDNRHYGIQMLQDEERPARNFSEWYMGYERLVDGVGRQIAREAHINVDTISVVAAGIEDRLVSTFLRRVAISTHQRYG